MISKQRLGIVVLLLLLALFSVVAKPNEHETQPLQNVTTQFHFTDTNNITLDQQYVFRGSVSISNITIYSLSSKANITLPSGVIETVNNQNIADRNETFVYQYNPIMPGRHIFNLSYPGISATKHVERTFEVASSSVPSRGKENISINQTVQSLQDLQKSTPENGTTFAFTLDDTYYYDYGPVIINGTVALQNSTANQTNVTEKSLEGEVFLEIMKGNESIVNCSTPVIGSNGFYCELPSERIEITDYTVKGELFINHSNTTFNFTDNFLLRLKDEDSLRVDVSFERFVESGQKQDIAIDISDEVGFVDNADVSLTILDPENKPIMISPVIKDKKYVADFVGLYPGVYTLDLVIVRGTQYRSLKRQFRITPKNVVLSLEVPDKIYHNYGAVNVSGNITVLKENAFVRKPVKITVQNEHGIANSCTIDCDGFCEFSCMLSRDIEFGNYTIEASVNDDLVTYRDNNTFSLGFKQGSLFLDLDYENEYYLEEVQDFFLQPKKDKMVRTNGSAFVLITGPDAVEYRIVPEQVSDGYAFSFVTLTPGIYTVNISYVEESLFTSAEYTYEVKNMSYEFRPSRIWEKRKKEDIKRIASKHFAFVEKFNVSEEIYQLPAKLGEPVRWIRFGKQKGQFESLNTSRILGKNTSLDLSYFETDSIPFTENSSNETKKLNFQNNYTYTDVSFNISLQDLGSAPKEMLLLSKNGKTLRNVTYFDEDDDGLIDMVEWNGSLEPKTTFTVSLLDSMIEKPHVQISTRNVLLSSTFRNPDVTVQKKDMKRCDLVLNNKTQNMIAIPEKNKFVLSEHLSPGMYAYKMFCDQSVETGTFVIPFLNKTIISSSVALENKGNATRVTSTQGPRYYQKNGTWSEIDTTFVPELIGDEVYYASDSGLYETYLYNASLDYPFIYVKDGHLISFALESIGTMINGSYVPLLEISNETFFYSEGNSVVYENLFGVGTNVTITSFAGTLKTDLSLSSSNIADLQSQFSGPLVVKSRLQTDLLLDNITSQDPLYLRTNTFEDVGITIDSDYYISGNKRALMGRSVSSQTGEYALLSIIPEQEFMQLSGDLIIDPSFTIQATDRDAMSTNNTIKTDYYDVSSPYLFVGKNETEIYQAGVQFSLQIPVGAIITDARITFTAGENGTENSFTPHISIENTTNAAAFSAGIGNISEREYTSFVAWTIGNWTYLENYTTPDLSSLLQEIITLPGWTEGNMIGFMIDDETHSDAYVSFHDYSSLGNHGAVLNITYLAVESNPHVLLENPANATFTSSTTIQFNVTPIDDEGIDTCELWGNFSGLWAMNQSLSSVQNGSINSFNPITLSQGYYTWNVWCNDTMGNNGFNATNFTLYIGSPSLQVYSDNDFHANFTLFENITFYANYTYGNTFIENATCAISFNDSVEENMSYDSSMELYTFTRQFGTPYNYTYNATCYTNITDAGFANNVLYIYPLINTTFSKYVQSISSGYNVTLVAYNARNMSVFVDIYDFVDDAFTPQFTFAPNTSTVVSGVFDGTLYRWRYFLQSGENVSVWYAVTPSTSVYHVGSLQIAGGSAR